MDEFQDRLRKAIDRGVQRNVDKQQEERAEALSEEELKNRHTAYRLQLSEHIERCIEQLPHHFPGFQYATIFGEKGWGAACSRDDFGPGGKGRRANYFSRLEMTIRPFSHLHVLELVAKATIRNKETFHRTHFEKIEDADPDIFRELVDVWVLEYAELFASTEG